MNMKQLVRKAHRYLAIFVGIQIFIWTLSGIYFTWTNIEEVRGEHLIEPASVDLRSIDKLVEIGPVLDRFDRQVDRFQLRMLVDGPVYEIRYHDANGVAYQLVDARTGEFMDRIDEQTAATIAQNDFGPTAAVRGIELLSTATPHDEFRGADLPVYRVSMDHSSGTNIYVSAQRGVVSARRTTTWRIFDFLWMMHTMDYVTRDDFNNIVIRILSVLGIITVLSGFVYWGTTSPWFRKRQKRLSAHGR